VTGLHLHTDGDLNFY